MAVYTTNEQKEMRRDSIVLVIPTLRQGGAERVMSILAEQWAALRYDVHIVLLAGGPLFYGISNSISVHDLGFNSKNKGGRICSEIITLLKLRRLIVEIHPLFVLSFMEKYNSFTIIASACTGISVFVSDRSSPTRVFPWTTRLLRWFTYSFATGIIAQTEMAREHLNNRLMFMSNTCVIPNPVRESTVANKGVKENIIISAGRLSPEKGHDHLIRAFSKMRIDQWRLVILGDGPMRPVLKDMAIKLGVSDRFELPGAIDNVDHWLERASIFAFPSLSEGFPNALAEAMAAGLPCVSFDCDAGPRDIIQDGVNGFLIPVGDGDGLLMRIQQLIDDPSLRHRIGMAAKNASWRFNADQIAERYLQFALNHKEDEL